MGWLLVGLAFAQSASRCAATDGSALRFERTWKSGGTPPGPDTVIARERWFDGETLLAEAVWTGRDRYPAEVLISDWGEERNRRVDGVPQRGTATWTTTVRLRRADGAALQVGGKALSPEVAVPMTCSSAVASGVP